MEEETPVPKYLEGLFGESTFLKALESIGTEQPHWPHPCSGCTFIGSYEAAGDRNELKMFDLYVHQDEALSARWGPRLQDYVIAEIPEAEQHRIDQAGHPIIEALNRWKEKRNG